MDKKEEFKAGDKVICIGMHPHYNHKLDILGIYTIETIELFNGFYLDPDERHKTNITWIKVKENGAIDEYESKYFKKLED